jgi:hypothetical protein
MVSTFIDYGQLESREITLRNKEITILLFLGVVE